MSKKYAIGSSEMRRMVTGFGSCIASDHITVQARKVGYMYREEPSDGVDSGWRFLSGNETQEFLDDPKNLAVYDVNTIANYDPDIAVFLGEPVGAAFCRASNNQPLLPTEFPKMS